MRKLTPRKAIREFCIECAGSIYLANTCKDDKKYQEPCKLHPHRSGKRPKDFRKQLTPMKVIRKHCICCMGNKMYDVSDCPDDKCNLYIYRMGRLAKKHELSQNLIANLPLFTNRRGNTLRLPKFK